METGSRRREDRRDLRLDLCARVVTDEADARALLEHHVHLVGGHPERLLQETLGVEEHRRVQAVAVADVRTGRGGRGVDGQRYAGASATLRAEGPRLDFSTRERADEPEAHVHVPLRGR